MPLTDSVMLLTVIVTLLISSAVLLTGSVVLRTNSAVLLTGSVALSPTSITLLRLQVRPAAKNAVPPHLIDDRAAPHPEGTRYPLWSIFSRYAHASCKDNMLAVRFVPRLTLI